jgi:DNA mismatch repair protein MutS
VESITASCAEYNLKRFFYTPLRDVDAVHYRHAVLRDLGKDAVFEAVRAFAQQMRSMREHLVQADKLHYQLQRQRWFLDAVGIYCRAVGALTDELAVLDVESAGILGFRDYLAGYTRSGAFTALASQTRALDDALATVRYSIHIKGNRVRVDRYQDQADYSQEVERTFAKFQQGAVQDHRAKLPDWLDMNHVEAQVLDLVAQLHPEVFGTLDEFCARHREYLDPTVGAFDREVQFYVAYLDYIERFKPAGLQFCYPRVSDESKEIHALQAYDIALANKLAGETGSVVCNDFALQGPECIIVVTGPNQGGKTTFARMFGQLHYLASLGLPVPGQEAALFLPDQVFTHFEKEEDLATLSGKLEDELLRVHEILQRATGSSVVVMNESFTSTTLRDALVLGREVMRRLIDLDLLAVYVTFVDELASLGPATVSIGQHGVSR